MVSMDKKELERLQKEVDIERINDGLTESVIEKQIRLNKLRAEHDINTDNDLCDGYAQ